MFVILNFGRCDLFAIWYLSFEILQMLKSEALISLEHVFKKTQWRLTTPADQQH